MNELHQDCAPNVHIVDSDINIMFCIGMADLIVSDESSVMFEGLFLDVPSIAVTDWKIPDCNPPRDPSIPYDFVIKTDTAGLKSKVEDILNNIDHARGRMKKLRDENFTNLGMSSQYIMDLIDDLVHTNNIKMYPLVPKYKLKKIGLLRYLKSRYRKMRTWIYVRKNHSQ